MRKFATGAAQLALLSQCAVVGCTFSLSPDGAILLEWGDPVRIRKGEADRTEEVMNALLEPLGRAIGRRPGQ